MKVTLPYWIKWILCQIFGLHTHKVDWGVSHCEVCGRTLSWTPKYWKNK